MTSRARTRARALTAAAVAAVVVPLGFTPTASAAPSAPPQAAARMPNPVDTARAAATFAALQQHLYDPRYQLYVSSDPTQRFGYLWDFVNGFAATDYMAELPAVGDRYDAALQARDQGVMDYLDTSETDPAGQPQPPAYASAARPPLGTDQPSYYDDNAWVALDYLQEYDTTHQRADLAKAEEVFHFVVSGWDASTTDTCPGGVFWEDVAGSPRNTISNAPNAEAGLEIYAATHDRYYLTWATQMYDWVRSCLMKSDGMYDDHLNPDGSVDTTLWSYNQGTMIGAGTLLYEVTGDRSYLQQAEQTAAASVSYFGSDGNLYHQPDVFNVIFFRNLLPLAGFDHDPAYARMAASYADTAWLQDRQPDGLFTDPDPSGGESAVNQTAPMAELYALLAQQPPVYAATGYTDPSSVVVQPGRSATTTLGVQSVSARPQAIRWSAHPAPGVSVSPSSGTLEVAGGAGDSTPVAVTGGPTDGDASVTFSFASPLGPIPPVSTSVIVARPGDLAPFYDNTGISDDTDQAAANLDGYGFSYSAQALAAAGLVPGAAVTSGGVRYSWPAAPAGQPDNVVAAGQVLAVPAVTGATELGILGTATNGPSTGPLTITYTDGTTQSATLGLSDWAAAGPSLGNGVAAAMPYRNSASGTSQDIPTSVYTDTIALLPGKTVASVTLPARADQGELHVFALGTDAGPLT